jgi:hypothetical protein
MWILWLVGAWLFVQALAALWDRIRGEWRLKAELGKLRSERADEQGQLAVRTKELAAQKCRLEEEQTAFAQLRSERTAGFPWLANAFADYTQLRALRRADALDTKAHPAKKAAEQLRETAAELREAENRARLHVYLLQYYESLFPWLIEFRELSEEDANSLATALVPDSGGQSADDPARRWLTDGEYVSLTTVEKYQRALDRYFESRKTNWQVGRDYERFVGYLFEQEGFRVDYRGALLGLEDMGRDLVAKRRNEIRIVQCKRWAAGKTIHEKHVFQLFGSALEYQLRLEDTLQPFLGDTVRHVPEVIPVLYTSTSVSAMARRVADRLKVKIVEMFHPHPYPCIKCNVSRRTGERIYHLPFDLQYDRVVIEPERGEVFMATVAAAEAAGFRRAYRWNGE